MNKKSAPVAGADRRSALVVAYASMSHGLGQAMQIIRAMGTTFIWRTIVHNVATIVNEQVRSDRPKRRHLQGARILDELATIGRGVGRAMGHDRSRAHPHDPRRAPRW